MSLVERSLSCNTLVCLLQAMEGRTTRVELRNETSIYGHIESVDAYMNVSMTNITFTTSDGTQNKFSNFFVQGRQIRFVHIPDDVNIVKAINERLATIRQIRNWREPQTQKIVMARKRERQLLGCMNKIVNLKEKET